MAGFTPVRSSTPHFPRRQIHPIPDRCNWNVTLLLRRNWLTPRSLSAHQLQPRWLDRDLSSSEQKHQSASREQKTRLELGKATSFSLAPLFTWPFPRSSSSSAGGSSSSSSSPGVISRTFHDPKDERNRENRSVPFLAARLFKLLRDCRFVNREASVATRRSRRKKEEEKTRLVIAIASNTENKTKREGERERERGKRGRLPLYRTDRFRREKRGRYLSGDKQARP